MSWTAFIQWIGSWFVYDSKQFVRIEDSLTELHRKVDKIMATLADLQAAVTAEDSVIDSAITLIKGLADQIAALQPNQAAIDALAADVKAKSDALAAAVAANTPATP
jgi:hypothetical protein